MVQSISSLLSRQECSHKWPYILGTFCLHSISHSLFVENHYQGIKLKFYLVRNYWIFCHFLTASPVLVERQRGRGSNHQKGQEYLLTYIEMLLRGFVQFKGLVGWNFCSWCGREALRLEIKSLHCLQVRRLGMLLASSGLCLKAMPESKWYLMLSESWKVVNKDLPKNLLLAFLPERITAKPPSLSVCCDSGRTLSLQYWYSFSLI